MPIALTLLNNTCGCQTVGNLATQWKQKLFLFVRPCCDGGIPDISAMNDEAILGLLLFFVMTHCKSERN